jgi:ferredoxin
MSTADLRSRRVRIHIDDAACTGHGRCYALAPEIFGSDDQGRSHLLLTDIPCELRDKARNAVSNCPEEALSIIQEDR